MDPVIHFAMLLDHPLNYFICQFHRNELTFRGFFYHYDGRPNDPEYWPRSIGNQIKEALSELQVIAFQLFSFLDFPVLNEEVDK